MKLSTRARYGTRALLDLALNGERGPILLKDIAERQQISVRYLEQLITPLIAGGMVRSTRGPRGGVSLARSPGDIRLGEVIQLLEGSIALADCIEHPEVCNRSEKCATRDVWSELGDAMNKLLESMTLQDLLEKQKAKDGNEEITYYI